MIDERNFRKRMEHEIKKMPIPKNKFWHDSDESSINDGESLKVKTPKK